MLFQLMQVAFENSDWFERGGIAVELKSSDNWMQATEHVCACILMCARLLCILWMQFNNKGCEILTNCRQVTTLAFFSSLFWRWMVLERRAANLVLTSVPIVYKPIVYIQYTCNTPYLYYTLVELLSFFFFFLWPSSKLEICNRIYPKLIHNRTKIGGEETKTSIHDWTRP